MSHYTREELLTLGFAKVGQNCLVSKKASFYGTKNIELGDSVRIDDFCVLSAGEGGIKLGCYIHIAVYTCLIGAGAIEVANYCNISSRVAIYSSSDDYSGEWMTNPMVDNAFTNVEHGTVTLQPHVIIGSGSVILPNVTLYEGVAVGALSLVNKDLEPFTIYAGQPVRFIKPRKRDLLKWQLDFEHKLSLPS
ncbi:acyltransferase [Pseudoalteromonas piscicida]|uniref:Galactoside O-acetyltransferase n=1 Tax=Pseudoalteromonas piscicida TaxID=43662 RepID=A0ABM6NJQ1_PSEO7|nr:acyltransferase [Pseudoalteromonas piscicida]ATD08937.1 galactoside O-acetyltransferase [Pseudoalteromonas piscicida]WPU30920.1 acyltransferase [Pseudoalteromonas piscicida]